MKSAPNSILVGKYVEKILSAIDGFIAKNLDVLTGKDLANFYDELRRTLKNDYFGGSWGLEGVTEIMLFRALYHIGVRKYPESKPKPVTITKNLKGFCFPQENIVLSAGRPIKLGGGKRIWPDIIVYKTTDCNETREANVKEMKSIIEIKAYPQGGKEGIVDTIERLIKLRNLYNNENLKLAYIAYNYIVKNESGSSVLKYLQREPVEGYEPIPEYIDVILLSKSNALIKDLLAKYI